MCLLKSGKLLTVHYGVSYGLMLEGWQKIAPNAETPAAFFLYLADRCLRDAFETIDIPEDINESARVCMLWDCTAPEYEQSPTRYPALLRNGAGKYTLADLRQGLQSSRAWPQCHGRAGHYAARLRGTQTGQSCFKPGGGGQALCCRLIHDLQHMRQRHTSRSISWVWPAIA